ncbi:glycosyltransferase family 1 protein [Patescibacteria group bacterium]|nr:MAG: glycosyltransferase family 1 protein [Patescibacteria group bacterium]
MKIAIDARIINTSTGRYIDRLLEYLQQIDTDNEYVVLLRADDFDRWQPTNPNFTKAVADYPPYTFREQIQFAWLLYRLQPDLVHFTGPQQPLLYFGKKTTSILDLTLVNFVNKRQEGPLKNFYKHTIKPLVFKVLVRRVIRSSDQLITITNFVRQQVVSSYKADPQKVTTTYLAGEPPSTKITPIPKLKGKKFILYVGNAFPYKNLGALIDAFAVAKLKDYQLVLAGKPDFFYGELAEYVQQRDISSVYFAGFVSDEELAWLYQNAELYVFPSLSEGFGLPGLEAMSYGLPVASSTATCLPEVYGDAAVYFDPEDINEMAKVIKTTLADKKLLAKLKTAGPKRAGQFNWKRTAEQTLKVYQQALKSE